MKTGLIEPHYLPSLEYFCALRPLDRIILETREHYVKQSYRNRCYINTANGPAMLVVPLSPKHGKVSFREIRIAEGQRWRNNHWRSIRSAYAKAPFFEHYEDELNKTIYQEVGFLFELDINLLSFCLHCLKLKKEVVETAVYQEEAEAGISDLRSQITPKKPASTRSFYRPRPYHQVFGNAFAGNLSLIDLLFCEGPGALSLLSASGTEELNK